MYLVKKDILYEIQIKESSFNEYIYLLRVIKNIIKYMGQCCNGAMVDRDL